MTKRLFIAARIIPDKPFLDHIGRFRTALRRERIKWVELNNIHFTLKFLGETEEQLIPVIDTKLREAAMQNDSITIKLHNLGIFGSRYQPRVVWAGMEPYESLKSLMQSVHRNLEEAGFPADRQNLVPHLTLGRIKELTDISFFQSCVEKFRLCTSEPLLIEKIILFESILRHEGPVYNELKTYPLKNTP